MAPNALALGIMPQPATVATFAAPTEGLPDNSFIMPALVDHSYEHLMMEELLLDFGAGCCLCPRDYAPECPIEPVHSEQVPRLVTLTGDPMKARWMVVRYTVCDTSYRVVNVAGLRSLGYSINFSYHNTSLLRTSHVRGL